MRKKKWRFIRKGKDYFEFRKRLSPTLVAILFLKENGETIYREGIVYKSS